MYYYQEKFYHQPTLLSSPNELKCLMELFTHLESKVAQASASELIDLQRYQISKNIGKMKRILKRGDAEYPFEFVNTLN